MAWLYPLAIQSNFARQNDSLVAAAAAEGLITTWRGADEYGREWRVTPLGMHRLWEQLEHE